MLTQIVAGRIYDFSHVVGRSGLSGMGFSQPVDLAMAGEDVVYVISRGYEYNPGLPWNETYGGGRVCKVTIGKAPGDEEHVMEFSKNGDAPGEIIWPTGIAVDSQEHVYVTDEWLNRVSIFDKDGNFLSYWGTQGDADGCFNGPAGIEIDDEDVLHIVDSRNHRIQNFSSDGGFLGKWGSYGSAPGQLDSPWGITIAPDGHIYVADHKNNRVQKFTTDGDFVTQFGSYGSGLGQVHRPSDVAVDPDGDVYICDWGNHRVQVFGPDGRFVVSLLGDAQELSKWAKMTVAASPDAVKRRREVPNFQQEWRFGLPTSVTFDQVYNRLLVVDCPRQRIQIYDKLKEYSQPARTL